MLEGVPKAGKRNVGCCTANDGRIVVHCCYRTRDTNEEQGMSLDESYRPTNDEEFMNELQKEYFHRKLSDWKQEILRDSKETILNLQEDSGNHPGEQCNTKSVCLER